MQTKLLLCVALSCSLGANAQEKSFTLLATNGEVQVRPANALHWEPAAGSHVFGYRETIRTGRASTAQIKTPGGSVFILPENSQIEIRELQKLSRDDVVLELTALAMQNLPARKDSLKKPSSAFVLHGAPPESLTQEDRANSSDYVLREQQGALALFEQGYLSGFILKWNHLVSAFPKTASEQVEAALIQAYEAMEMPARAQQAIQQFEKHWPNSKLGPR
jgi:hypothetical protein